MKQSVLIALLLFPVLSSLGCGPDKSTVTSAPPAREQTPEELKAAEQHYAAPTSR